MTDCGSFLSVGAGSELMLAVLDLAMANDLLAAFLVVTTLVVTGVTLNESWLNDPDRT